MASKYLKKYGVRLDPESEVIVCLGSKEGFSHMCLALVGPGDTAIVPAPYFPVHVYAVALAAANVIALEVADSEKFLSNVAYTCQHLYPKPKLLIVNYPHNPSTVTVEPEFYRRRRQAGTALRLHGDQRLCLCRRGVRRLPAAEFLGGAGRQEVGVEFTTMSKGYNMAGWRVGFCAGNAEMVRALGTIKTYYDYGMFEPIQIAAIMALRHTDAAVEAQSVLYQRRRDVLCEGLQPHRLGRHTAAGRHVRVGQDSRAVGQQMDTMQFATKLLEEGDVAVSPGSGFGPAGEGYLRLALVENENRLRQAVRQIGRCLASDSRTAAAARRSTGGQLDAPSGPNRLYQLARRGCPSNRRHRGARSLVVATLP